MKMGLRRLTNYTDKEQRRRLPTYFKFMFVRNPFTRFLSAYNDKFRSMRQFNNSYLGLSLKKTTENDIGNMSYPTDTEYVSFKEFVSYVVAFMIPKERVNPHWSSMQTWCDPCAVQYDYLGKIETLARDTKNILSRIGVPELYDALPSNNIHARSAGITDYYSNVSTEHLFPFLELFKNDTLLFGYRMPDFG